MSAEMIIIGTTFISLVHSKQVSFPCVDVQGNLKPEFADSNYAQSGMENKIVCTQDTEQGNVFVVQAVKSATFQLEWARR